MFRCIPYCETMKEEWDRFVFSQKGTIFHTTGFRQILLRSFGYTCCYHAIINGEGRISAVIPLVAGRNLGLKEVGVSLPFVNYADICADSKEALAFAAGCIPQFRDTYGLHYVELRLKDQNVDNRGWSTQLDNYTFVLALSGDEQQILSQSSGSNRNHVRKVYKNNWFDVSFDPVYLDAFYKVYCKRMKQLGSPAPDIGFFRCFFEYLPENTFLLTVIDKETGTIAGGMLLLTSPANLTLYYPYGANLIEYNAKYLNSFMYWEAVKLGLRTGMEQLDLGRSQAGSGTYRYKEQWGAKAHQLTYVHCGDGVSGMAGMPDRKKLSVFIELWKVLPACLTDSIGKPLIKYIMP